MKLRTLLLSWTLMNMTYEVEVLSKIYFSHLLYSLNLVDKSYGLLLWYFMVRLHWSLKASEADIYCNCMEKSFSFCVPLKKEVQMGWWCHWWQSFLFWVNCYFINGRLKEYMLRISCFEACLITLFLSLSLSFPPSSLFLHLSSPFYALRGGNEKQSERWVIFSVFAAGWFMLNTTPNKQCAVRTPLISHRSLGCIYIASACEKANQEPLINWPKEYPLWAESALHASWVYSKLVLHG